MCSLSFRDDCFHFTFGKKIKKITSVCDTTVIESWDKKIKEDSCFKKNSLNRLHGSLSFYHGLLLCKAREAKQSKQEKQSKVNQEKRRFIAY